VPTTKWVYPQGPFAFRFSKRKRPDPETRTCRAWFSRRCTPGGRGAGEAPELETSPSRGGVAEKRSGVVGSGSAGRPDGSRLILWTSQKATCPQDCPAACPSRGGRLLLQFGSKSKAALNQRYIRAKAAPKPASQPASTPQAILAPYFWAPLTCFLTAASTARLTLLCASSRKAF